MKRSIEAPTHGDGAEYLQPSINRVKPRLSPSYENGSGGNLFIRVNEILDVDNIRVEIKEAYRSVSESILGQPELHEATHTVVGANNVTSVTVKPTQSYRGATWFKRFNILAAIAPYALGFKGTGHDLALAKYMVGNFKQYIGVAIREANRNWDKIVAVAKELKKNFTLGRKEIFAAMNSASKDDNTEKTIQDVWVSVTNSKGKEWLKRVKSTITNGVTAIPESYVYPTRRACRA